VSHSKTTFWGHLIIVLRYAFHEFKWGRDLSISTALALAGALILMATGIVSRPEERQILILSILAPFVIVFGLHIAYKLGTAPWRIHQEHERRINELLDYKKKVEEQEVKLEISPLNTFTVLHRFPDRTTENAYALRVLFSNKRKPGLPGKIAKDVQAKISFIDATGKNIPGLKGRWAETDQPELRGPLASKLDLLRVDFFVGSDLQLDLAAKFIADAQCFAIDNDSFPMIRHERTMLTGPLIKAVVELQAVNVHQLFEVEFINSDWEIACKSVREL
jgi:hypothetical protein